MKTTWSVVVIYDDAEGRERAVEVCDHLVERYWATSELDVSWFSCSELERKDSSEESLSKAKEANCLIFALSPHVQLPGNLEVWLDRWLDRRPDREGALLDLMRSAVKTGEEGFPGHHRLRQAAHQAGMDYLTHEPSEICWTMPESLDSFAARAEKVSSVLDEILHAHRPPPALPSENFQTE